MLETLWDSFEERNLVLQGILGLASACDVAAGTCSAEAAHFGAVDPEKADANLHPIVLLALGVVSFRDSLRGELDRGLATTKPLEHPPLRVASIDESPGVFDDERFDLSETRLFELLR